MRFDIHVVGARHDLSRRTAALEIGDFLRTFIHQKDDELDVGIIFHHRIGNMLEQRGFARARRSDDKAALPFSNGRHEVNHAGGIAIRNGFQFDPFQRADDRQLIKGRELAGAFGLVPVDFGEPMQLRSSIAFAGLALDPLAIPQVITADNFRRDKDIARILDKAPFGIPDKAEAFAGDFHDTFAETEFFVAWQRFGACGFIAIACPLAAVVAFITIAAAVMAVVAVAAIMALATFVTVSSALLAVIAAFRTRSRLFDAWNLHFSRFMRSHRDRRLFAFLLQLFCHVPGNVDRILANPLRSRRGSGLSRKRLSGCGFDRRGGTGGDFFLRRRRAPFLDLSRQGSLWCGRFTPRLCNSHYGWQRGFGRLRNGCGLGFFPPCDTGFGRRF